MTDQPTHAGAGGCRTVFPRFAAIALLLIAAVWLHPGAAQAENVAAGAPPYCGDPFAYCENRVSAACLNPASGGDLSRCDDEWGDFDRCIVNVEKICSAPPSAATASAPSSNAQSADRAGPGGDAFCPEGESRIALVIGNSEYGPSIGALRNPRNDADLMTETLERVCFDVIKRTDLDQRGMKRAILEFGEKLAEAKGQVIALFFFAGHGVQLDGRNYLIPLGAEISREGDVPVEAVPADDALAQMRFAKSNVNIVLLDACRNNPFETGAFRSLTRGLARMDAPRGTMISFATGPGEVAEDGEFDNSPFTQALAEAIVEPDVLLEASMNTVRAAVYETTNQRQVPWTTSSIIGRFYFLKSR